MEKKMFSFRQLVVVVLFVVFFCMLISGIALYIQPTGKVAYWMGWSFLGLSKTDWSNLHILFVILFLVMSISHMCFNWRLLIHSICGENRKFLPCRELIIAFTFVLIVFISGVYRIPPLSYILDGKDSFREAWVEDKRNLPPLWQVDETSFQEFCHSLGINIDEAKKELSDAGYILDDSSKTLFEIAVKNKTSPLILYELIRKFQTKRKGWRK